MSSAYRTPPDRPVSAPELLSVIRIIEKRAVDAAHRALRTCSAVFRYGIATGVASRDIAADLRGALSVVTVTHHAAITDPKEIGGLLRAIDGYQGSMVARCALKLATLFGSAGANRPASRALTGFKLRH